MKNNHYTPNYGDWVLDNIKLGITRILLFTLLLQITTLPQILAATTATKEKTTAKKDEKSDLKSSGITKTNVTEPISLQLAGDTVVVRHSPGLNSGRIEGSVRVLLGESLNLNSGLVVTSDLIVPGTPNLNINGSATYNGTVVGSGSTSPSGYSINVNSGVSLRHINTRVDPITISSVGAPPNPSGNTNLTLNPGQTVTSFTGVRDIILNSNYGQLVVPPGTYGNFTANTNCGFTLGIDNQNTVYNLLGLTLNSSSQLQIRGNVTINLGSTFNLGSPTTIGNVSNPVSLNINTNANNINLNSNVKLYGMLNAPQASVNVNSGAVLKGLLISDRLNLNGGLIQGLASDSTAPTVSITQPTDGQVLNTATTTVSGTFADDSVVNSVKVNGVNATISGNNFTANNIALTVGNNTVTVVATDIFGNAGNSSITVVRNSAGNQAPSITIGSSQTVTLPATASLNATVTDDGQPNPPGQVTINWSKMSGSGTVTFSNPTSSTTTATFSSAGTYVVRISASDSILTTTKDVTVTVNAQQNTAPVVSAGNNQTITLPSTASLVATATDDGLPNPPGSLTYLWSKTSGPGTVTFSSTTTLATSATFSTAGTYVLGFTANDSLLSTTSSVTIVVNPQATQNTAPVVSAGQNQTIQLPANATLNGSASDDGLPNPPSSLSISWTKVGGPGTVTFSSPNTAVTQASFSVAGTYTLRLSANDSALTSSSDVTVTVTAAVNNLAPVVNAGADQVVILPDTIKVTGTVTDDGLPNNTLTYSWSQVSGPGIATFLTPTVASSTVVFDLPGVYVVRLTASDGQLSTSSDVKITLKIKPKIMIYSNPAGFEPSTLTTSAGDKILMIRNRTNADITYVFTQGTQSVSVLTPGGKNTFINVSLVAGTTATLTSVEFPNWNLTITVVP